MNHNLILTTSCDWRPRLFVIKTMAIGGNVWKYIDPDQEDFLPEATRPVPPRASEASNITGHNTLISLTPDERDIYKLLYSQYKEDLASAKQEIDTLKAVRTHLVTTVSKENIVYI